MPLLTQAADTDSARVFLRLVGPEEAVEIFGIRLVGLSVQNGKKLLLTLAFLIIIFVIARLTRSMILRLLRHRRERAVFWSRQVIQLVLALLILLAIASIWFSEPRTLATAFALITAGLAFALQKVVTAVAGYFVILRGKTFNVGDRVSVSGVRGDVIALGFIQTKIMEMGLPPAAEGADPAIWVQSRQYTGRIVSVSNARIFDEPVYNYSLDFPFIWEELDFFITLDSDRERAEEIILEATKRHTTQIQQIGEEALRELERRYLLKPTELGPRVYYRLGGGGLQLSVRFITEDHGARAAKDAMNREILAGFEREGIQIASTTIAIVRVPPVRIDQDTPAPPD